MKQTNRLLLILIAVIVAGFAFFYFKKENEKKADQDYAINKERFRQCLYRRDQGYMFPEDSAKNENELDSLAYEIQMFQSKR